ncbi:MAG: valine--tRNA ligase [Streptococcaceae bacterium]|jgi:valyl-tRNA synthetase|nr:valine--tRNA ligase [Streptococcaceae bacterium]
MTEKKNLSIKYCSYEVEVGRYQKWLEQSAFKPSADKKAQSYSIVIPPPNVTGKLHLGHAWNTTLQDIIIRQKKMKGYDTLWLPGMDHAGIATQAKVEKKLAEQGISRYDLGREKFVKKVWNWKEEYAREIRKQWAKLGLSLDYSRECFTLDEGVSAAVCKVFVKLYKKGLIYRGKYIINWDPEILTALSDIEVIHKEVEGAFYHMRYDLEDGANFLEIVTTRPETMFGDTAVAVNPKDSRYKDFIGKYVILPIINKKIPVIADEHANMEFGTGVVKITPAHDPNDFEVGHRHDLSEINVMNDDGTMNKNAGEFAGMDRFDARKAIVEKLEKLGHLVKVEKMMHSVGHSERSGVMVESRLSTQWFVRMEELAKQAIANQATDGAAKFFPSRFNQTFLNWMENVHDWVISRQLWWGHQIPAWYRKNTGEVYVGEVAPADFENWKQDPDVLDTWFSSALWPFSTMGWPDIESEDFKRYFPTNTLVTGYDIISFWVSRMIFQSLEFTKQRPFENVLIHGLIRAEDGRKMSKSLRNGIDPMEVIDKYGADALRWFLSNGSTPGQDIRFSYEKMNAAWNFINKIWNISRFIIMNNEGLTIELIAEKLMKVAERSAGNVFDRFILSRLNETIEKVDDNFECFEFGEAGRILYNFIWDEFADWYLEFTKEVLYGEDESEKVVTRAILTHVLDQILRLLHPIMPFVTEAIFEYLPYNEEILLAASYPKINPDFSDKKAVADIKVLKELIRAVRTIRLEANTPLSRKVPILIKTTNLHIEKFLQENENYIRRFTNPKTLTISNNVKEPEMAKSSVLTGAELYLPLKGLLNLDKELARLQKDLSKLTQKLKHVQDKLTNKNFMVNAPEKVVEAKRIKEKEYLEKLAAIKKRVKMLQILD